MKKLDPKDVKYIIVHDTDAKQDFSAKDIDTMHRTRKKDPFEMIGYHWVVRQNGKVEAGRPENFAGAHVSGDNLTIKNPNSQSIGIAMSNKGPIEHVPKAQRDALVNKIAELSIKFNVPVENVRGHGEVEKDNSDMKVGEMNKLRPLIEARVRELRRERGLETPTGKERPQAPAGKERPDGQRPPAERPAGRPAPAAGTAAGAGKGAAPATAGVAGAGAVAGTAAGAAAAKAAPAGQTAPRGATADEVTTMQRNLKTLGMDLGKFGPARDGVDGKLGPVTEAAVRQFEKSHGMPETGAASPATRAAIATAAREAPSQTTAPGEKAGQTTAPGEKASPATAPGQTAAPGQTTAPSSGDGAGTPHPDAGAFLREADGALSNLLDRHTNDVPGTLAALVEGTRGPGSGDLGRTTAADVQQLFARATAGSAALPLSKTEAGLIAGVLDERSRLVSEGATPAPPVPSGDGATGRAPVEMPVPTASDGAGQDVPPARAEAPNVPSSIPPGGTSNTPGGTSNTPGGTAEPGGTALPRQTGQRQPAETGPSL